MEIRDVCLPLCETSVNDFMLLAGNINKTKVTCKLLTNKLQRFYRKKYLFTYINKDFHFLSKNIFNVSLC